MVRRGLERALALLRREGDSLAKGVSAGRQPLLRRGGDQLVDDLADIMSTAILAVGGQRVEGEQGRNDAHGCALAELVRDIEQPELARRIETVAGLDLDRRAPAMHQ